MVMTITELKEKLYRIDKMVSAIYYHPKIDNKTAKRILPITNLVSHLCFETYINEKGNYINDTFDPTKLNNITTFKQIKD